MFEIEVDSTIATNKVYGIIAKLPVPFHLPNDDGCTLGVSCPYKADSVNSESVTLPVLAEYPKVINSNLNLKNIFSNRIIDFCGCAMESYWRQEQTISLLWISSNASIRK